MMRYKILLTLASILLFSISCISRQTVEEPVVVIDPENPYQCQGYKKSEESCYILPYKEGEEYLLVQGNCSRYSHYGVNRYAYDFGLPMKTEIIAARSGKVVTTDMVHSDNTYSYKRRYKKTGKARGNSILILHDDGSVAVYYHLMHDSALVEPGDIVNQGDVIALSGNSGFTTGAHLHFEVHRSMEDHQTIPVTFKNADPGEEFNLKTGNRYLALSSTEKKL